MTNGRAICFGRGLRGRLGTNDVLDVGGSGGPTVLAQGYINLSENVTPIEGMRPGAAFTCVLRCSGRIVCFGGNTNAQLGQNLIGTSDLGDTANEVEAIQPVPLDYSTKIIVPDTSLTTLTFSTGLVLTFNPCQTFYIVRVMDAVQISVSSFTAGSASSVVTVNNGPATAAVLPLSLNAVNLMYVRVANGGYETLYTLTIRRLSSVFVAAGSQHACILSSGRVACWGRNDYGQLGRDDTTVRGDATVDMNSIVFVSFTASLNAINIVEVALRSSNHNCALFATGSVVCWGFNLTGQLGAGVASGENLGDAATEMVNRVPIVFASSITHLPVSVICRKTNTCGTNESIMKCYRR